MSQRIVFGTISFLVLFFLASSVVLADDLVVEGLDDFDQVLVNSNDWKVVYQGLLFAGLVGVPGDFVVDPSLARSVVSSLSRSHPRVLLIETAGRKQFEGLDRLLREQGFVVVSLSGSELQSEFLGSIRPSQVIVLDERYPYNSVSVAPYALLTKSFVVFADAENVNSLVSLIQAKNARVMTYGLLDIGVKESLSQFSLTVIDEGGKFDNNVRIVEEFRKIRPVTQVILTNGEFIEAGLIDDFNPVLFVGQSRVPSQVEEFFLRTNVSYGVVVGNHLSSLVQNFGSRLKNTHGKETFFVVRFAKSPRVIVEQFSQPQALEYFSLPIIPPELVISSLSYNRLTKSLEVTYTNPSVIPVFFSSSFIVYGGDVAYSVGDDDVQSIASGQSKTRMYDLDMSSLVSIRGEGLLYFGDYPSSLEFELSESFGSIPVIDIADDSQLEIESVLYDKYDKAFYITVHNPGDVLTFSNIEFVDVIVDGITTTIGTKKVFSIEPKESKTVYVRASLSELDILENEVVLVRAIYGAREQVLFKETEKLLSLQIRLIRTSYIVAVVAVLIIIALILLFFLVRKREYVCQKCGHYKKSFGKPNRHSCGGKFRKS